MPRAALPRLAAVAVAAILGATAGLTVMTTSAAAQQLEPPRARQGYYVAVGGYGSVSSINDDGTQRGPLTGASGSLRLGQLLTRRFGLGILIDSGADQDDRRQSTSFAISLEAQREFGHHLTLRGAVGFAFLGLTDKRFPDEPQRGAVAAGYTLGLSWDWFLIRRRLSGGLALTPVLQGRFIPAGPVDSLDTLGAISGLLGLEVTWWTGLPRNQLDLPPSEAFSPR